MAAKDENLSNGLSEFGTVIRIVLLGDKSVGCNTLLSQFTSSPLTASAPYRQREVAIDGINVRILLFHWRKLTAQCRNLNLASWAKMLHGAVLVFDINNHDTLACIETYLTNLSQIPSSAKSIAGNKMDFLSRFTTPVVMEGKEIARKNSLPFYLTNALTGENVEEMIVFIAAKALVGIRSKSLPSLYIAPTCSKSAIAPMEIEDTEQSGSDTVNLQTDNVVQASCCRY